MIELIPSFSEGFATHEESRVPNLWHKNVGVWAPFLGRQGTKLYEWSGFKNHGAITGATWDVGKFGRALNLDGSTDYINMGIKPQFNFGTGDLTLIVVAKTPSSWHTANPLLLHSYLAGIGYFLRITDTSGTARIQWVVGGDGGAKAALGSDLIGLDSEYCFAGTRSGNDVACLVNGEVAGTNSGPIGDIDTSARNFVVGADAALGGELWKDLIMFVGVWSRIVSAAEQRQICNDIGIMFRYPYEPASFAFPVAAPESIGAMLQLIGQSPIQTYSPGVNR